MLPNVKILHSSILEFWGALLFLVWGFVLFELFVLFSVNKVHFCQAAAIFFALFQL